MNESSIKLYLEKVEKLIESSKEITNKFIIYLTPHATNAILNNNKDDIGVLNKFNQLAYTVCRDKSIDCFEPNIFEDEFYTDIVHFNSLGHKKMTEILLEHLK